MFYRRAQTKRIPWSSTLYVFCSPSLDALQLVSAEIDITKTFRADASERSRRETRTHSCFCCIGAFLRQARTHVGVKGKAQPGETTYQEFPRDRTGRGG